MALQQPFSPGEILLHTLFRNRYFIVRKIGPGAFGSVYKARDIQSADRLVALKEVSPLGLHSQHPPIIFRDLKPANIMRTPTGQLYLIDFGIARYFKPGQPKDTVALGSLGYAAPEQYGKAQTTPRADIYSLGAVLHQFLTA